MSSSSRTLKEKDLSFNFENSIRALKFDQQDPEHPEYHDLPNMPRVDFIVEMENDIFFIEVKDTDLPNAADVGAVKFLKKLVSGTVEASLVEKYLFTFFFRWAEKKLEKSVHFISLITLTSPDLLSLGDSLETKLYSHFKSSSKRWQRTALASCQVHNISTWTQVFPDWPITRLSSQSDSV